MKSTAGKVVLVSIITAAAAVSGCASTPRDADTFGRGVSGEVQSVEWGTIQALRAVSIESGRQFLGRLTTARPIFPCPVLAHLVLFHGVDAEQANPRAVHVQRVSVDHAHRP